MFIKSSLSCRRAVGALAVAATLTASLSQPLTAQVTGANGLSALAIQRLQVDARPSDMAPQMANLILEDVGGSIRIAAAGKLRMLSQRVSVVACNYVAGVATERSLEIFKASKAEFRKILTALVNGDEGMGIIGAETQRKTLAEIKKVEALWLPFEAALDGIIAGTDVETNVAYIAANNDALLAEANVLTSKIAGEYANPAELTQASAMLVDISARQRMLTQKIAKLVCAVATGNASLGNPEDLSKAMEMFEVSLNALRNGLPEAGINPPPTPEIKALLDASSENWTVIKAEITKVTGPGSVDVETQARIFDLLDKKLAEMIKISALYAEEAKPGI